ncbi:MAG: beta strand repeat-containing protein [Aestuariivirga sp.]
MTDFLVSAGTTQTARISMSGVDTLTVEATGTLSVSANAQAVRFNGVTTNGIITNSGVIEQTAGGRAIRIENGAGATPTVTITNNATGIIQSGDDAIQIQAGAVTGGTVSLTNNGSIASVNGQAVDLAGGTGAAVQNITNSNSITSIFSDAIRIGGIGTVINSLTINGGTAADYSDGTDGIQFEDNSTGAVTNNGVGAISGDRHGVNGGLGAVVTVSNAAGGTITGRNGSGVGLDGTGIITNFGTITGTFSNSSGSDINGTTVGLPNGGGPDGINDGDGDGIDVDGQATIVNHGSILGTGAGGSGSDGRLNTSEAIAAGGGTFTNSAGAIISGLGLGMLIDDSSTGPAPFVTSVVNNGTISGTNSVGIRIIGVQNDTIENGGTISGGGGIAIQMGDGNDTLKINTGSSITGTSQGEAGADTLDYSGFGSAVVANLASGAAVGTGGISGFEAITGSAQSDRLYGDGAVNTLAGGQSNDLLSGGGAGDTLTGGDGDDRLAGGTGADAMTGNDGNDTYYVDNGGDSVSEIANQGIDTVRSTITYTLGSDVEKLYLSGTAANGTGNAFSNYIFGNAGANTLDGMGGADRLDGGQGDDIYVVDSTGDLVFETTAGAAGGLNDLVQASVNHTLSPSVENLTITAVAGQVNGTGNSLVNTMVGGSGKNYIDGKDGSDTLTGGLGSDQFTFTTALGAANIDTVTDYDAVNDYIRIDNAIFTGLAAGFLDAAALVIGAAATTAAHRIVYNSATGALLFDADGVGGAAATQFATLSTGLALAADHVFVI